ncbi:MAG TPA: ChbG/HpnK family deacetylase [Longilinea sp.]|nr:ChbG/HpnK family deacetylase [Longilinea sp.]
MARYLIVNADDYGLSPGVSEGIRQAHLKGIVTSTTAMMNQAHAAPELPKVLEQCPRLGLGVHLTLTVGKPLLPPERVSSLVDDNGHFLSQETYIARVSRIEPEEVLAEWHAQVERFIQVCGRKPDHLDAHHHCAYFTLELFQCLLTLAEELDCPIRQPYGSDVTSAANYLAGGRVDEDFAKIQSLLARYSSPSAQAFCSEFYDRDATLPYLEGLIEKIAASTFFSWELMCHPAIVDDYLFQVSSYTEPRGREFDVLTDSSIPALLEKYHIELISFSDINLQPG